MNGEAQFEVGLWRDEILRKFTDHQPNWQPGDTAIAKYQASLSAQSSPLKGASIQDIWYDKRPAPVDLQYRVRPHGLGAKLRAEVAAPEQDPWRYCWGASQACLGCTCGEAGAFGGRDVAAIWPGIPTPMASPAEPKRCAHCNEIEGTPHRTWCRDFKFQAPPAAPGAINGFAIGAEAAARSWSHRRAA